MSSDLPPFVPNTPPPLCHSDLVDSEEDDFGDFSSTYDSFESPKKKPPDLNYNENEIKYQIEVTNFNPKLNLHNMNDVHVTNNEENETPNNITNHVNEINHHNQTELGNNNVNNVHLENKKLEINTFQKCPSTGNSDEIINKIEINEVKNILNTNGEISISDVHSVNCMSNIIESKNVKENGMDEKVVGDNYYQQITVNKDNSNDKNNCLELSDLGNRISNINLENNTTNNESINSSRVTNEIKQCTKNSCYKGDNNEKYLENDSRITLENLKCIQKVHNSNDIDHLKSNLNICGTLSQVDSNCVPISKTDLLIEGNIESNDSFKHLSINCDTSSMLKKQTNNKGISNEIKKFLENEKYIENEFTNFESKFRHNEHSTIGANDFDDNINSPPTSPYFEPKIELCKSFDNDLDEEEDVEFGNFENFNIKSSESMEFGDFKSSNDAKLQSNEINESTNEMNYRNINALDNLNSESNANPNLLIDSVGSVQSNNLYTSDILSTETLNDPNLYSSTYSSNKPTLQIDPNSNVDKTEELANLSNNYNLNVNSDKEDVISTKDIQLEFNDNEQNICDNNASVKIISDNISVHNTCLISPTINANNTVDSETTEDNIFVKQSSEGINNSNEGNFTDDSTCNMSKEINTNDTETLYEISDRTCENVKIHPNKTSSEISNEIIAPPLDINEINLEENDEFDADFDDFVSAQDNVLNKDEIYIEKNSESLSSISAVNNDSNTDSDKATIHIENINQQTNSKCVEEFGDFESNFNELYTKPIVQTHEFRSDFVEAKEINRNQYFVHENIDTDEFGDFNFVSDANETVEDSNKFETICSEESLRDSSINANTLESLNTNFDDDDDDDFGEFSSECVSEIKMVVNNEGDQKIDKPSKVMFDINSFDFRTVFDEQLEELPECNISTLDNIISNNKLWTALEDIEKTPALSYQWANSESNKVLLLALKIDTRNIIFGPRWNDNVPRFAANLGYTPLEPSKVPEVKQDTVNSGMSRESPVHLSLSTQEHVPDAHFDWTGSGLTNPLDSLPSYLLHLDVISVFDTLSTSQPDKSTGTPKSSRETLEEEFSKSSVASGTTSLPLTPVILETSSTVTDTPNATSLDTHRVVSDYKKLISDEKLEKFINSLPDLTFMLKKEIVHPKK